MHDHYQPVPGKHPAAKLHFFQSAEADNLGPQQIVLLHKVAGQLRRHFANDHARHQWGLWHVPAHPKFLEGDVFIAGANLPRFIDALAGQTEKARADFRAAVEIGAKSPDGIAAQQELDKLAAPPSATDSQGARRPDHFPELSSDTSPIIVAATVTLPGHNYEKGRASLGPSMEKFLGRLEKQPGLLGMHTLMSMDHPGMLVILTWWKDKKALNDWFYSDVHRGIIQEYYGAGTPPRPAGDSAKPTMNQSGQIGMELFTSLPGSIRYGGGLTPDSAVVKKT